MILWETTQQNFQKEPQGCERLKEKFHDIFAAQENTNAVPDTCMMSTYPQYFLATLIIVQELRVSIFEVVHATYIATVVGFTSATTLDWTSSPFLVMYLPVSLHLINESVY